MFLSRARFAAPICLIRHRLRPRLPGLPPKKVRSLLNRKLKNIKMTGGTHSSKKKAAADNAADGDDLVNLPMVAYTFDALVAHLEGKRKPITPEFPDAS